MPAHTVHAHSRLAHELLLLSLLVLASSGCRKNSNPVGPGSVDTGGPITDATRQSSIVDIERMAASLKWVDRAADKAALVRFLQGRPEFEEAAMGEDASVWARYTDGRLLIICKNRRPAENTGFAPPPVQFHVVDPGREFPVSGEARLMNAMGTRFINPTSVLASFLRAGGYHVTITDPSVANLMKVSGDGVFYLSTHGDSGKRRDHTDVYCLWTSTKFDTVTDRSLKAEWDAGRLAYFLADMDNVKGFQDSVSEETHFGITSDFVQRNMSFGSKALIYLDACGGKGSDSFRKACVNASNDGSAITAGWTNPVGDREAADATYFVIGRLLGFNPNPTKPEDPPQRPFDYQLVYQDLVAKNLDSYTDPDDGTVARFGFVPTLTEFGILAPSIKYLTIDEDSQTLFIDGIFGKDPRTNGGTAKVTVDGVALPISTWENSLVQCTIPKTGAGSAGDVIVTAFGHPSNTVQLTEWRGTVTFNQPSLGQMGSSYKFNLHFRADVHSFRDNPGEAPHGALEVDAGMMDDSNGEFAIGGAGSRDCPTPGCTAVYTENWAHIQLSMKVFSGTVPSSAGFYGLVSIVPDLKKVSLIVFGGTGDGLSGNVSSTIGCPTPSTNSYDYTFSNATVVPKSVYIPMTMNDAYVIAADHLDVSTPPSGQIAGFCDTKPADVINTISWTAFQPKFPPDVKAAQKIASTR